MRRQSRRLAGAAAHTAARRHINTPAGEEPERSEGGGEVKEGESGRATAGSDKRPRLNNNHFAGRQREAVIIMYGAGTKADGVSRHRTNTPRLCVAVPRHRFSERPRVRRESEAQRRRAAAELRACLASAGAKRSLTPDTPEVECRPA